MEGGREEGREGGRRGRKVGEGKRGMEGEGRHGVSNREGDDENGTCRSSCHSQDTFPPPHPV